MRFPNGTTRWLIVGLASALALGCDLFDDDDDTESGGGEGEEVSLLPVYAYQLVSVDDDPIIVTAPLLETGDITLRVFHDGDGSVFGTYTVADGTFTIDAGSTLSIWEVGTVWELYGDFTISFTEDWIMPPDGPPTQGAFTLNRAFQNVDAEITPDGALRLSVSDVGGGAEEVTLSFEELDDIMDGEDPGQYANWVQWSIFALQASTEFLPELASLGIDGIDVIDAELADTSPLTVSCDAISDLGLSVPATPPGIPDQGSLVVTWYDDQTNGEVGPGDSFDGDFSYCLEDDPDDDIDTMLNGRLGLYSFTEVISPDNEVTRIGFEGISPTQRAGGLVFDALERWEIFDADGDGAGTTAAAELVAVIDGRMTLVFFEPVN